MQPTFNEIIHAERGKLLSELPKGAKVFCSAGCAGRWYFDWIQECYGDVDLHYGVELYSPKPSDLPPNVVWIQNSVSDMVDVPTGSVDLLFSGQNIEHLYFDDLVGFFAEVQRVLKPGGHFCIDSPNRIISEEYGYTQPQHVLELSRRDITQLLESAGFDILTVKGIWSSKSGGELVRDLTAVTDTWSEQLAGASDNPDEAFIWWIVARQSARDAGDVKRIADDIASRRFPGFVRSRFRRGVGELIQIEGTEAIVQVSPDVSGYAYFGPYVPLREGSYAVTFMVKFLAEGGQLVADVVSAEGANTHGSLVIAPVEIGAWHAETIIVDIPFYSEGVETRLYCENASAQVLFGSQILKI